MEEKESLRIVSKIQCGGCQKYFSGMGIFDLHRVGSLQSGERRCLSSDEMLSAGMMQERCLVNVLHENHRVREEQQVWYDVVAREKMRQVFRKSEDEPEET